MTAVSGAGPAGERAAALLTDDVDRAAAALRSGGLVAMPTETVYGLAALATDPTAVRRIFEVKGRPADHPLIVHLAEPEELDDWSGDPSPAARRLAATAWPGPLTVIVGRPDRIPPVVSGGRDTVGLRVPAHPVARRLIAAAGAPLAAPSANRYGAVSPTTAAHVLDDLADSLEPGRDLVLDGGACEVGVESTIVDCTVEPAQILRSGGVPDEDVAALLTGVATLGPMSGPSRASGMLRSHYAPQCAVRLVDHPDDAVALAAGTVGARVLDLSDDLPAYASSLYDELRRADRDGVATLIAVLPRPAGLGHAIRDRLEKAAAPRPDAVRAPTSRGG